MERLDTRTIRVGVTGSGYAEHRNIIDLPFRNVRVGRHRDLIQVLDHIYFRATNSLTPVLHGRHMHLGLCNYDVLHFFNKTSLSNTPWVSTFENHIPRLTTRHRGLTERLLHPKCIGLISMSERALLQQEAWLAPFPDLRDAIMARTTVMHPAQKALVGDDHVKPNIQDGVRCLMVGHDLFRKGGLPMLRAFDRVLQRGGPFHLTIVSRMHIGDYVSQATSADLQEAMAIIGRHPERITLHSTLPNAEVLRAFREAHVALLTTFDDTYGYSVLEGQAHACATITTDVCALPEINDEACGWMITLPQNERKEATWRTQQGRAVLNRAIEEQLEAILDEIAADPGRAIKKGLAGLARIRRDHDPQQKADTLEALYRSGLNRQ